MSEEMQSEELEQITDEVEEDDEKGQGGHTFFAVMCFLIAVILLGVWIDGILVGIASWLLIIGIIMFAITGVFLFQQDQPLSSILGLSTKEQEKQAESEQQAEDQSQKELTFFEQLVQEALDSIPDEFHEHIQNLGLVIEQEPDRDTLQQVGIEKGHLLLGLYQGVPLTAQGHASLPEKITIYQGNIERYCHGNPECIRGRVRQTVLHEVAHHFGMGHESMPLWLK